MQASPGISYHAKETRCHVRYKGPACVNTAIAELLEGNKWAAFHRPREVAGAVWLKEVWELKWGWVNREVGP